MSRSRKKVSMTGMSTARSDQPYKRDEHRRERRAIRTLLVVSLDSDDKWLHRENYGNPCKAPKDGKQFWPDQAWPSCTHATAARPCRVCQ